MTIRMKTGDTAPHVHAVLLDAAGDPVDLAAATVRFILATRGWLEVRVDAPADMLQIGNGTDGSRGLVRYPWAEGDTAEAGTYDVEFEVTYSDGTVQSFPTEGYVDCVFEEDLGGTR